MAVVYIKFRFRMFKVRKCLSSEIRKNLDELDQYVDGFKKAEKHQWPNLEKNGCKCLYKCNVIKDSKNSK